MNNVDLNMLKDRAVELMTEQLDGLCAKLNAEFEEHLFYVKGSSIYIDCSDYSPRNLEVIKVIR